MSLPALQREFKAFKTTFETKVQMLWKINLGLEKELRCVRSEVCEARSLLDSSIKEKASMEEQLAVLQPKVNQLEQQAAVASEVMKELQPEVKETRARLARSEEDKFETDRDIAQLRASMEKTKVQLDAWEQTHLLVQAVNCHRSVATLSERSSSLDTDTADLDRTSEQVCEARSLLDTTIKEKASMEEQLAVQPKVNQLEQQAAVASNAMKVKQQSLDLLKRRDEKDELVEGALGLRLANIEEQVLTIKPQLTQISQLREHVVKLSNTWQLQGEASSVAQRVAQLEGSMLELQCSRRRTSPSPTRKEEPSESLWAKQMAALSVQQDQYCEQLAIVEDKVTNLWQLTPRICELEHQQKDFWQLQEQLKSLLNIDRLNAAPMASAPSSEHLLLQLSEQRQVTERCIEQLKGELLQYTTSVADVRDEMRRMIGQQGEHFLKLTGENYSGFLDRLAGLERQLHERAPESQKLKSLMEETTLNLERRLNSFERQLKEGQTRAMDTRFEHLDGIRRLLESRLSTLELQLREARETESPSPELRLASMERKLREGQEEHARQLRGFEERLEYLETKIGDSDQLAKDLQKVWEAVVLNRRDDMAWLSRGIDLCMKNIKELQEERDRTHLAIGLLQETHRHSDAASDSSQDLDSD